MTLRPTYSRILMESSFDSCLLSQKSKEMWPACRELSRNRNVNVRLCLLLPLRERAADSHGACGRGRDAGRRGEQRSLDVKRRTS